MGHVDVVDVLLDDVIAAGPDEVVPVAHLVLHFGQVRTLLAKRVAGEDPEQRDRPAVPIDPHRQDVADGAVVDPLDRFDILRLMMALQADADLEVLLLRLGGGGDHAVDADRVGRHRLLHEHMLAGPDGGLEMDRPEARRRGEQHDVDPSVERLLIGVEADEPAVFRHIDLVGMALRQLPVALGEPIGKRVGHRDELDRPGCGQRLLAGPGAAPAAADQGDLDQVVPGGMSRSGQAQRTGECAAGGQNGRRFQKFAP